MADARDLFEMLRWQAYREVIGYHRADDPAGFDARVLVLAGRLAGGLDGAAVRATAARVAEWTWRNHDPARVRERYRPCAALVRGIDSVRERQAIGGQWASEQRREANVLTMAEAYNELSIGRFGPSKSRVAEASGLSLRTVQRRWDEVVEMAEFLRDKQSLISSSR